MSLGFVVVGLESRLLILISHIIESGSFCVCFSCSFLTSTELRVFWLFQFLLHISWALVGLLLFIPYYIQVGFGMFAARFFICISHVIAVFLVFAFPSAVPT